VRALASRCGTPRASVAKIERRQVPDEIGGLEGGHRRTRPRAYDPHGATTVLMVSVLEILGKK
jgi:hypothetical protein